MDMQLIQYREALMQAIDEEMQRDENVYVLGEEVGNYHGAYKVTKGLLEKYGEKRIIDTPISENGFTGLAIGSAMTGLRPVCEFMNFCFTFVGADQIISNASKMHYMSGDRFCVPIVFRGPNGVAPEVAAQHSFCVESMYANIPGLKIVAPYNAYDAKGLLKTAIRDNDPVLFLEHELLYGTKMEIPKDEYLLPFGKAQVLQEGENITIISWSRMTNVCLDVVKELKDKHKISAELIDLRSIKPLDIPTIIKSIQKTNNCVIVEEGHSFAGIAAELCQTIVTYAFDYLDSPVARVCQRETPTPYSKPLEHATLPNRERIISKVLKTLNIN
jgi:pyruvate dehydrogenase E1 component beta subunit